MSPNPSPEKTASLSSRPSIILVDSSLERGAVLGEVFKAEGYNLIDILLPDADLLRALERHQPEVVIIDMDSPGRDTLELLRTVQTSIPRPMVMFSRDDNSDTIRRAVAAGVSAYVVDGVQNTRVRPLIDEAIARFNQYRALEEELAAAQAQLAQRKTIEKAKGILMRQRGCDEDEAYRLLRTQAMSQNRKLVQIAESLISAVAFFEG